MKITQWLGPVLMVAALGCGSKPPVADAPSSPAANTKPAVAQESLGDATTPVEDRDTYQPAEPVVNVAAEVLPVTAETPPETVVSEFLNAMKSGNEGVTAGLLTDKARVETGKHGLAVQPPGSPLATYEVTEGEVSAEDPTFAQVGCLWSEKDEAGNAHSEQVIWVLRKESHGWRVCGMATQIPTRTEPVFFDFENPPEMNRLEAEITQEMQAAETSTVQTETQEPVAREARTPTEGNSLRQ